MTKRRLIILMAVILAWMEMLTTLAMSKDTPMMTKEELKAMPDSPDLVIIDVRYDKHWVGKDYLKSVTLQPQLLQMITTEAVMLTPTTIQSASLKRGS